MVLKWDLYVLNMASNSFHKYFGDFLIDIGFIPSIEYQDLLIHKYNYYEEYYYIETHVDDVIIAANNTSK